jgi:hypothetical protein
MAPLGVRSGLGDSPAKWSYTGAELTQNGGRFSVGRYNERSDAGVTGAWRQPGGARKDAGYPLLGPRGRQKRPSPDIPPPLIVPRGRDAASGSLGWNESSGIEAACADSCTARPLCIGYRIAVRASSAPRQACVLLRGLRSTSPEECEVRPLRGAQWIAEPTKPTQESSGSAAADEPSQTLWLRESSRSLRKPFRESTRFGVGDTLRILARRGQLSNVPTKVLLSHIPSTGAPAARKARKARRQGLAGGAPGQVAGEVHWGFFIDWKRQRSWASTYEHGGWGYEVQLHRGSEFPFSLGSSFSIELNHTAADGILLTTNGRRGGALTRPHTGGGGNSTPRVNHVTLQGASIESAVILYSGLQWRRFEGQGCANEELQAAPSRSSWPECRAACEASSACSGFSYAAGPLRSTCS